MAQTRKLLPTEAPLLAEHLIRLSPDDRRLRFGGLFMPDDVIRRYVQGIDWIHSRQVGCFDAGAPRGVVQLSLPRSNIPMPGSVKPPNVCSPSAGTKRSLQPLFRY